jgi:gamma-glutamyl:cysteine ligase YbdK (ATP-grasp superfamily)
MAEGKFDLTAFDKNAVVATVNAAGATLVDYQASASIGRTLLEAVQSGLWGKERDIQTALGAVREQWEQEQEAQRQKKPAPSKTQEREPEPPEADR